MTILYIYGEDNTVVDALSHLPINSFPDEISPSNTNCSVNAIFSITSDKEILASIKSGYLKDEFCKQVAASSVKGWCQHNNLWYIGDRLLILRIHKLRENLFRLAHNTLGHFGADKSYASLHKHYYWPNMCKDLKQAYIPFCSDCLRNKSHTSWSAGPLHPLPILDWCGGSVAMDFIRPLPLDSGYDCILSITDQLGSDVRIIPTCIDITTEDLAVLFFDNWFCENRLPDNITCNCDKLFISKFWKSLINLTGVKLKMFMSYSYHPKPTVQVKDQTKP
jgi:hypothetical protein